VRTTRTVDEPVDLGIRRKQRARRRQLGEAAAHVGHARLAIGGRGRLAVRPGRRDPLIHRGALVPRGRVAALLVARLRLTGGAVAARGADEIAALARLLGARQRVLVREVDGAAGCSQRGEGSRKRDHETTLHGRFDLP
jgi:hypothetical protein